MRLLLDKGVPYDKPKSRFGRTALHCAVCSNIQCVETLLDHVKTKSEENDPVRMKQFVDEIDSRQQTSLHIAASLEKWQTVKVLLEHGATQTWYKSWSCSFTLTIHMNCSSEAILIN